MTEEIINPSRSDFFPFKSGIIIELVNSFAFTFQSGIYHFRFVSVFHSPLSFTSWQMYPTSPSCLWAGWLILLLWLWWHFLEKKILLLKPVNYFRFFSTQDNEIIFFRLGLRKSFQMLLGWYRFLLPCPASEPVMDHYFVEEGGHLRSSGQRLG